MADIISSTHLKAKRHRVDCLGELGTEHIGVLCEAGKPVLRIVTKDIRNNRRHEVTLSQEETAAVMRIMLTSQAWGMAELRQSYTYPPHPGGSGRRLTTEI